MSRRALVEILCFLLLLFSLLYVVWMLWWLLKVPLYDDVSLRMGIREGLVKLGTALLFFSASVGLGIVEELYEDLEARRWSAGMIELPVEDGADADDDDDAGWTDALDEDADDAPDGGDDEASDAADPAIEEEDDSEQADESPAPAPKKKTRSKSRTKKK